MFTYDRTARDKGDTPLRQAQLVMLEMLITFDDICKKHNLQYWLEAGTLLGAIRHHGFIPWDDDLDIGMPRNDYEKFMKIVAQDLPKDLFFQTRKTDPYTKWRWIKIRDNYSTFIQKSEINKNIKYHQGIFIDIFPYDFIEKDFHRSKIFLNRKYQKSRQLLFKHGSWFFNQLATIPVKLLGYKRLSRYFLNRHTSNSPKLAVMGIEVTIAYHIFDYQTIFPLSQVEFENHLFSAPHEPHQYLTNMYGDYMKLPPEEQRKVHAFKILPYQKCNHPNAINY
jgi:lipopolysaccharide cholinephosphotransferase